MPQPKQALAARDFVTLLLGVSDALAFLHSLRLLHRDVAARNVNKKKTYKKLTSSDNFFDRLLQVLVDERGLPHGVKLSDLGSAHNLIEREYYRQTTQKELPVRWMPPETLKAGIFTAQGDVWSFGVLAYEVSARK